MKIGSLKSRLSALLTLTEILSRKTNLNSTFEKIAYRHDLIGRDRNFALNLVATTLRNLGVIDYMLNKALHRPLAKKKADTQNILRLGICQLLILKTPAHAAISTSVDLVKYIPNQGTKDLVNAVLRSLDKKGPPTMLGLEFEKLNIPSWLWESWAKEFGDTICLKIANASLREAPLNITVKSNPKYWASRLKGQVTETGSLSMRSTGPVNSLPGYREGCWWVQDAAASLPIRLLGNISNLNIADICAAPGGKTAQLAALGAIVTAVDKSKKRLGRLSTNLDRLGLSATIIAKDIMSWEPKTLFDAVLLDSPCSGTGTLRRRPDILRTREKADIEVLKKVQYQLLSHVSKYVKIGGKLVYCVCSIQPEEGPLHIKNFLENNPNYEQEPIQPAEIGGPKEIITHDGYLRTLPFYLSEHGGMDGFFAVRFTRTY
jgi:16S rRNA (cytosine967-C5)-methyltransferase